MNTTKSLLSTEPIVIAHRGASAANPENTMPAFSEAFAGGARWVETDVQPTSDDTLVLIHDDLVDRTTDGAGRIREYTYDDAQQLDAGSWFDPRFAGTQIPTLAQLLTILAGERQLLLEIKGDHTSAHLEQMISEIRSAGRWDSVFLQSFEIDVLARLRALLPDEPIGLLVEEIGTDPVADCRRLGATCYNPDYAALLERPEIVGELHAAGLATLPWFVNAEDDWAALTEIGVDGIITDRPAELVEWQRSRNELDSQG